MSVGYSMVRYGRSKALPYWRLFHAISIKKGIYRGVVFGIRIFFVGFALPRWRGAAEV